MELQRGGSGATKAKERGEGAERRMRRGCSVFMLREGEERRRRRGSSARSLRTRAARPRLFRGRRRRQWNPNTERPIIRSERGCAGRRERGRRDRACSAGAEGASGIQIQSAPSFAERGAVRAEPGRLSRATMGDDERSGGAQQAKGWNGEGHGSIAAVAEKRSDECDRADDGSDGVQDAMTDEDARTRLLSQEPSAWATKPGDDERSGGAQQAKELSGQVQRNVAAVAERRSDECDGADDGSDGVQDAMAEEYARTRLFRGRRRRQRNPNTERPRTLREIGAEPGRISRAMGDEERSAKAQAKGWSGEGQRSVAAVAEKRSDGCDAADDGRR
eukprot:gene12083-biopygen10729